MILNEIRSLTTAFEMVIIGFVAYIECLTHIRGNYKVHASGTFLAFALLYEQFDCVALLHSFSKRGWFAVSSIYIVHLSTNRLVPQEVVCKSVLATVGTGL